MTPLTVLVGQSTYHLSGTLYGASLMQQSTRHRTGPLTFLGRLLFLPGTRHKEPLDDLIDDGDDDEGVHMRSFRVSGLDGNTTETWKRWLDGPGQPVLSGWLYSVDIESRWRSR